MPTRQERAELNDHLTGMAKYMNGLLPRSVQQIIPKEDRRNVVLIRRHDDYESTFKDMAATVGYNLRQDVSHKRPHAKDYVSVSLPGSEKKSVTFSPHYRTIIQYNSFQQDMPVLISLTNNKMIKGNFRSDEREIALRSYDGFFKKYDSNKLHVFSVKTAPTVTIAEARTTYIEAMKQLARENILGINDPQFKLDAETIAHFSNPLFKM